MKSISKNIFLLLIPVMILSGIFNSCKPDDDEATGTPMISYIRFTDPAIADSAITSANMGQLIAIMGEHLGTLNACYFNDLKATLNPAYITDKSVILNIPNALPTEINDQITLIFKDGTELTYAFIVDIAPPVIYGIKCEYVPEGENIVLYGDFLFSPTVIFPGDVEGVVVREEKEELEVIVPAGAESGQIVVRNSIGTASSPFYFRDDRNVIVDFDTKLHETWTAPIIYVDSVTDATPCSGNYVVVEADEVAAWNWVNTLAIMYDAANSDRGDVPLADGIPSQLDFRFEVNVPTEWIDVRMEIYFAPYGAGHGRDLQDGGIYITSFYRWEPWRAGPYTTDGWVTISIPLSDFNYEHDDPDGIPPNEGTLPLSNFSNLRNFNMMIFGPASPGNLPVKLMVDNIRIVPNTLD
jgi:hypothetical protein